MNYVVPKVPSSVKFLYVDSDPIAYHGACGVEKTTYNFVNKLSGDETQMFPDARTAKHWLKDQCEVAEMLGTSLTLMSGNVCHTKKYVQKVRLSRPLNQLLTLG